MDIPPPCRIVPEEVLVQARFLVPVLPREPEVDLGASCAFGSGIAKRFAVASPGLVAALVGRQDGRAQVVGGDVVVARLAAREAAVVDVRLPYRVGAPQICFGIVRVGVESIGFGDLPCFVGFGQQGAVAIEVVGGLAAWPLGDGLGNSAPEGVVAVADREACCVAGCCGAALGDFNQPLGGVVAVVSLPAGAAFAFGVALRGVAEAGLLFRNLQTAINNIEPTMKSIKKGRKKVKLF